MKVFKYPHSMFLKIKNLEKSLGLNNEELLNQLNEMIEFRTGQRIYLTACKLFEIERCLLSKGTIFFTFCFPKYNKRLMAIRRKIQRKNDRYKIKN